MKCMHLSDLHLGKRLIEVSLLEDQAFILDRIGDIAAEERPQAVLIAGDVYDRSNPPVEAMTLFARFVGRLADLGCRVLVISGNHDSPERVAYLGELTRARGVYLSPAWDGRVEPVELSDEFGAVRFWPVPFIHPEVARGIFPGERIESANDAARLALGALDVDPACRNVVLSHQFVSGSRFDEREQRAVGALDNVDPALYGAFDYVALGHIHGAQAVGRSDGTMRYCGTPLKFSRREASAEKSVTLVELGPKGDVRVRVRPLKPLREVRAVRGAFDELMLRGPGEGQAGDWFFITLTDEEDVPNAAARLRERFGRVLALDYDNARTRGGADGVIGAAEEDRQPMELLAEFYRRINHRELGDEARAFAERVMRETEGFEE